MGPILFPHVARGIVGAASVFIIAAVANRDIKFCAAAAGVAAVAVIAFSLIATTYSALLAGACVGAGLGVLLGGIKAKNNMDNDYLSNIFSWCGHRRWHRFCCSGLLSSF